MSPALTKELERLAEREGTTKRDVFRRMVTMYKAKREEGEFIALQREMARHARETGVFINEEVDGSLRTSSLDYFLGFIVKLPKRARAASQQQRSQ